MSQNARPPLFPLRLVPFERYMLADNRATYPMAFPFAFEMTGELRRPEFEAALEETLRLHPLLRARIDDSRRDGPYWIDARGQMPSVDWDVEGVPYRFPRGQLIDLSREPGLRLWVRKGNGRTALTMQFHHSCCDGIGACRFIGDLFAAYGIRTATKDRRPRRRPVEPGALRTRGEFQISTPAPASRTKALWDTLRETIKWCIRRPTPLALPPATSPDETSSSAYPGIEVHQFNASESRALRELAGRLGATVNDLLLRDLFLAMLAWNEQQRPGRPGRWLQVNMPINMRKRLKNPMPAANKMSYAFLARRTRDIADPKALLDGIRRETGFVKQWGLGIYFLAGLSWALKIPGAVPLMVAGKRCFATAVLTNLGDFRRRLVATFPQVRGRLMIGDLVLERIRVVAPIRPMTHASFAVITYANELNIDVRCDPKRFSLTASRRLLDLYVHFIRRSLAGRQD